MQTDQQAEAPAPDGAALDATAQEASAPDASPPDEFVADVFSRHCASRTTVEHVATKWGTLALVALADSSYRFNALRRRVDGVSERMLSQTLQTLERDGFVVRDVQASIPPRVEYALTPLGARVAEQVRGLFVLLEDVVPEVAEAQQRYDAAH